MAQAIGVYDGHKVLLLEPLDLPANTPVVVISKQTVEDKEQIFWHKLLTLGLIESIEESPVFDSEFKPALVSGPPVSETVIEERR